MQKPQTFHNGVCSRGQQPWMGVWSAAIRSCRWTVRASRVRHMSRRWPSSKSREEPSRWRSCHNVTWMHTQTPALSDCMWSLLSSVFSRSNELEGRTSIHWCQSLLVSSRTFWISPSYSCFSFQCVLTTSNQITSFWGFFCGPSQERSQPQPIHAAPRSTSEVFFKEPQALGLELN